MVASAVQADAAHRRGDPGEALHSAAFKSSAITTVVGEVPGDALPGLVKRKDP